MLERLPAILLETCVHLEAQGIAAWLHGEELLDALRPRNSASTPEEVAPPTRALICLATPNEVMAAMPRAIVTASCARRLTQPTPLGPIDLLPSEHSNLDAALLEFGLAPLALAYRPTSGQWADPTGARGSFETGVLDLAATSPNPFARASRRYWIAARMLSEYALEPSTPLLEAARSALPESLENLPQGAPARREIGRVLTSSSPTTGLAFLRESGVTGFLFPRMDPRNEEIVARLPPYPPLRWAAWLRGCAIQSAMARLRMPIRLARHIEQIHRAHPLDRSLESLRDVGLRKLLARLDGEEIEGLLAWRRLELDAAADSDQTRLHSKRLAEVESRLAEVRAHREQSGHLRALALDGKAVMLALGSGPGPHVGLALAYLATVVQNDPTANERTTLERELRAWAEKNADAIR